MFDRAVKMRNIGRGGLALLLALTLFLGWNIALVSAHASLERTEPAPNSQLPAGQMPKQIKVWFAETVEPAFSELSVFDEKMTRVDTEDSKVIPGDPQAMQVSLKPGLPDGPYTVIYKNTSAEDGHSLRGSFSFLVGAGELNKGTSGLLPLDVYEATNQANSSNQSGWSVALRWLNYLAGAALVGALAFALLVWRPAVIKARATKRMGTQLDSTAYGKGLSQIQLVVWAGLVGLLVGWIGWSIYQAAAFSEQGVWQVLGIGVAPGERGPRALKDFFFDSRYGAVWLGRLGLLVVVAACWLIALRGLGRLPGAGRFRSNLLPAQESNSTVSAPVEPADAPLVRSRTAPDFEARRGWWWATLGAGAGVLLTGSLNSHAAAVSDWKWLAVAGDWLHLASTGLWVGGLIAMTLALIAALPALLPGSGDRTRLLSALIPSFSQLAILSVMTLLVTGTFNAALQLGEVSDLFSTPYGISLTVKIGLLLPLLLLGAYNLLVVTPRMRAFAKSKKAGLKEGAGSIEAGKLGLSFRRSVMLEVGLGCLVLVAAAFLTSSAPPKSLASAGVLYFQSEQGGLKVALAISPAQVGENGFEVSLTDARSGLPIENARLVDLRLLMQEMDMGNPRLELKPLPGSPGRYFAKGTVLGMAGHWNATLVIQRDGFEDVRIPVSFKLSL